MTGSIKASGELPRGWWLDPVVSETVHARIRTLLARGELSDQGIARAVGVSGRTMVRLRAKMRS